jgi:hypothetical protein
VVYFKVTVTSDEGKSLKAFRIVTGTWTRDIPFTLFVKTKQLLR